MVGKGRHNLFESFRDCVCNFGGWGICGEVVCDNFNRMSVVVRYGCVCVCSRGMAMVSCMYWLSFVGVGGCLRMRCDCV